MKKEEEILKEIKRLKVQRLRDTPCKRMHWNWYRDKYGELQHKDVPCKKDNLCGHCKALISGRSERVKIKILEWVLE